MFILSRRSIYGRDYVNNKPGPLGLENILPNLKITALSYSSITCLFANYFKYFLRNNLSNREDGKKTERKSNYNKQNA